MLFNQIFSSIKTYTKVRWCDQNVEYDLNDSLQV